MFGMESKAINGGEEKNYEKDYMKIKLNSYDNLPLNKPLIFHAITIIIRSVLGHYTQVFLGDTLYELSKCCNTKKLMFQKELTLIKQVYQKNACFVINSILKMLGLDLNRMFGINVMMFLKTAYELKNIVILNVKGIDFRCILQGLVEMKLLIG